MGLFGKRKKELLEWQNLISATPSNKLVMTEKQLLMLSKQMAENHLRIAKESAQLCEKTKKPDIFFSRYNLLVEHDEQLVKLSKYIEFSGTTPQSALNQVVEMRPIAIKLLIDRCIEDAESLKTEAAKTKRYAKILNDFMPYKAEIDEGNWNYLENQCKQKE